MAVHAPPVDDNVVSDLQERFRGTLLHPKDSEYGEGGMIWNATIDGDSHSSPSVWVAQTWSSQYTIV